MKRPIIVKLFLSYLLLILALSGILLAYVFSSYSSHAVETTTISLNKLGYAVEHMVKPLLAQGRYDELNELLKKVEKDILVRTTIIDSQGVVLADSEYPTKLMENHRTRPEIRAALEGVMGRAVRYSTTLSHDMLYVALPMKTDSGDLHVIRMSVPLENIDPLLARVKKHTLELAFIIIVSSLLVALLFSHMIATPIRELYRASRCIAGGDFKARVTLRGGDEIQDLSQSFTEMAEQLERTFTDLPAGREEL
ncbi:HAMP domain-containing protein, partial [bacterium]|nr:HAMP domain-containing protein [bacterium]